MAVIRITREFRFESAHALKGYDGPCRNIHGHSYELSVTVTGFPVTDENSPKLGMVMDFGDLKRLIQSNIIDPLDHTLVLDSSQKGIIPAGEPFANVVFVDFQPTSENLLLDFAVRIKQLLPPGITLHHLILRETASSFAEWFAEDQEG
jgi:6-pyruvoyltetrahydropterin/6-carboxytetrahydropterin synthase